MELPGHSDVIDKAPLPGEKPLVFEAAQRTPDIISDHARAAGCRALRSGRVPARERAPRYRAAGCGRDPKPPRQGVGLWRSFTSLLSCRCVLSGTVVAAIVGQCIVASPMTGTPEAPGLLTPSRRRASFTRSALI